MGSIWGSGFRVYLGFRAYLGCRVSKNIPYITTFRFLQNLAGFVLIRGFWSLCRARALPWSGGLGLSARSYPRDLRTHILRHLGPKTILYMAFGLF